MSFPRHKSYRESGVGWLGEVPSSWRVERLKTLVEIKKRIAGREGPDVLSITQKGIKVRDTDSNEGQLAENYAHYQLVEPGDFAMNQMDLLTGWIDISSQHGVTSPDYRVFSLRQGAEVSPRFLLYVLRHAYERRIFFAYGQGASHLGRWRLPTDAFQGFRVPVPSTSEQLAIVSLLDRETSKIDALVEEQKKLILLLKEKRQVAISNAVTRGLDPSTPMKDSEIKWIGEIPEHWKAVSLRALSCKIESGVSVNAADVPAEAGEIGVLKTSCVYGGTFRPFENKTVIPEERDRVSCPVKAGHLVVSRMNTPDLVGAAGYVYEDAPNTFLPDRLWQVAVAGAEAEFVYYWCQSASYRSQVKVACGGTSATMQNLGQGDFLSMKIAVPPRPEQQRIVQRLNAEMARLDDLVRGAEYGINLLLERRAALTSAAVTGKINLQHLPTENRTNVVRDAACAEIIRLCAAKPTFGRVKMQKLVYLAEAHLGIDEIGGDYSREAAGPLDRSLVQAVERSLQAEGIVDVHQEGIGSLVTYTFTGRTKEIKEAADNTLGARCTALRDLLMKVGDLDTLSVEAIATLYAVWNDALIDGETPDEIEIIRQVLEEWHPEKAEKFNSEALSSWLAYMRRNSIIPQGRGPRTHTPRLFP